MEWRFPLLLDDFINFTKSVFSDGQSLQNLFEKTRLEGPFRRCTKRSWKSYSIRCTENSVTDQIVDLNATSSRLVKDTLTHVKNSPVQVDETRLIEGFSLRGSGVDPRRLYLRFTCWGRGKCLFSDTLYIRSKIIPESIQRQKTWVSINLPVDLVCVNLCINSLVEWWTERVY